MVRSEFYDSLKDDTPKQKIYSDIIHMRRQALLISLVMPLGLAIVSSVVSTKVPDLDGALQTQLSIIRSKGFSPVKVYTDPQAGFVSLVGQFAGVEMDVSGAGDHLAEVDICIRRIKESIRSIQSELLWDRMSWYSISSAIPPAVIIYVLVPQHPECVRVLLLQG